MATVLRLALVATIGLAGLSAEARAETDPLPPATSPEAMTLELGVLGGLFVASGRHELYDPALLHREIEAPAAEVGLRAAFFPVRWLGAEVEGSLLPLSFEGGGSGTGYGLRGHLLLQYPARITPFALVGGGALGVRSAAAELGDDTDEMFHWGFGLKAYLTELFSARLEGRHLLGPSLDDPGERDRPSTTSHFGILFGLGLTFPRADRPDPDPDADGFRGIADRCPDEPGIAPDGCPRRDTDGDGFVDREDRCPDRAGSGPDGCPPGDEDGDGVPDRADACPEVAGPAEGCPDRDGDGVPDRSDACPARPGVRPHGCPADDPDGDGVTAGADRCPATPGAPPTGCPDQDGDGIPDADDACPTAPEVENDFEDEDGCPDEVPEAVRAFAGALQGINFATGSARIRPRSFAVLNDVAEMLLAHTSIEVVIEGHTDDIGDHDANVALSLARAEAVKAYLVEKGVASDRLVTEGFGPDRPVDTNRTRVGRARNRRIELRLADPSAPRDEGAGGEGEPDVR